MEDNQLKTGKFALTYGLLLGAINIAFGLILYSMDMHYQGGIPVMVVSILFMLSLIIVGIIQFRKANDGFMSFGQGLKVGVGICLVGGIVGLLFNQLMMGVIDPDTMAKAMEFQRGQLIETTKLTPQQIDAQMEMAKKFSTPAMQITFGLLFTIILGFLLSLIPALVLKKTKNIN